MSSNTPTPPGLDDFIAQNSGGSSGAPAGLDEFVAPEIREQQYGTVPQQALTALEGGASALTFGASKGLERLAGVDPEGIKAREEENPISNFVGQGAGLLAGVGAAGLMGAAGVSGAGALGLGEGAASVRTAAALAMADAEAAGLTGKAVAAAGQAAKNAAVAAQPITSRFLGAAVNNAIQGAMMQGGNEVGKLLLVDDPSKVNVKDFAETALGNMGLAAALGGGIGAGFHGVGELWGATVGKKLAKALGNSTDALEGRAGVGQPDLPQMPSKFQEVENAAQLKQDFDMFGLKPTTGSLAQDEAIRITESELAKKGTFGAAPQAQEYKVIRDKIAKESEDLLKYRTDKSEYTVGKEIKEGIKTKLADQLKPIEAEYAALKPELKKVPISLNNIVDASDKIMGHEYAQIPEMRSIAEGLVEKVKSIQNLDQLKTQRTFISDQLDKAYRAGGPESQLYKAARDALTDMRNTALSEVAQTGELAPSMLERVKAADSAYSAYKTQLKGLGVEAGLGKLGNARSMLEKFGKLSDESFANKVFDLNDVNQLNYFKQNFPKEFDLARRSKLAEIHENSLSEAGGKRGAFEVDKFLKQINDKKLGPEARDMLFDGMGAEKLRAIRNIYRNMPGNFNPPNTAAAASYGDLLSPKGLLNNLTDYAQYGYLKALPHLREAAGHVGGGEAGDLAALKFIAGGNKSVDPTAFQSMAKFIAQTIKGESALSKATKAIFDSGETIGATVYPSLKDREKLDKRLKELQANNAPLLNVGDQVGGYMPDHAAALAQTSLGAVNYLNSIRPSYQKSSPLDSDLPVSAMQKHEYDNALDIAQKPLIILGNIKDGTITPQSIKVMKTLYPGLYARTASKLQQGMIQAVHDGKTIKYKTRLGLSMFLGKPLDSTMTPSSIMAVQSKPQQTQQQLDQSKQQQAPRHSMTKLDGISTANQTPQQQRQAYRGSAHK